MIKTMFAFFLLASLMLRAVDFPSSGGDFASETGWGQTVPVGQDVSFANNGTYWASADVIFAGMNNLAALATFDLEYGNGADVRTIGCSGFYLGAGGLSVLLSGGAWVSTGWFSACSDDATLKTRNNVLVLTNGVSVSAVDSYVSNKDTGNLLRISAGSILDLSGSLTMGVNDNGNNRLEILSGGRLSVKGAFQDGSTTGSKYRTMTSTANSVLIDGLGSALSVKGGTKSALNVGAWYCDNSIVVSNGGALENDYRMYIGCYATVTNTRVSVESGSTLSGALLVIGEAATGSVLRISGGSVASMSGNVNLGGYATAGCSGAIEVEDAEFSCKQLQIGIPGSRDCRVKVSGGQSVFTITKKNVSRYPFFTAGSGHEFVLDGATWRPSDNSMQLDEEADDCTVRLENGASLELIGGLFSGTNDVASCGNSFVVGNGSCFTGQFVRISRRNNSVVVSNGCLAAVSTASSGNSGVRIGDLLSNVTEVEGNLLALQGRSPQIRSVGAVRIVNGSTLRFDVPAEGFDAANVPITCSSLVIDGDSFLRATGVPELRKALKARTCYTLAVADEGLSIPNPILAAANKDLADSGCAHCKFGISDDGKELYLKVSPENIGLCIILR